MAVSGCESGRLGCHWLFERTVPPSENVISPLFETERNGMLEKTAICSDQGVAVGQSTE